MSKSKLCLLGTLSLSLLPALPSFSDDLPPLSWSTFDQSMERIIPQPEEILYEEIEWRSTLAEAINEAAATEKPVLVWAMNGDPCGFT